MNASSPVHKAGVPGRHGTGHRARLWLLLLLLVPVIAVAWSAI